MYGVTRRRHPDLSVSQSSDRPDDRRASLERAARLSAGLLLVVLLILPFVPSPWIVPATPRPWFLPDLSYAFGLLAAPYLVVVAFLALRLPARGRVWLAGDVVFQGTGWLLLAYCVSLIGLGRVDPMAIGARVTTQERHAQDAACAEALELSTVEARQAALDRVELPVGLGLAPSCDVLAEELAVAVRSR